MRLVRYLALFLVPLIVLFLASCGSDGSSGDHHNTPVEAVFIGSSQLNDWIFSESFPNNNYVKKAGLSNTSAEMLARFQTDAISIKPKVIVIWAGENDIDRAMTLSETQSNITQMKQLAAAANIKVVLCTLSPKKGTEAVQNPTIVTLNTWIREFGTTTNTAVADFYPVLVDDNGELATQYARDNEHLTTAAYHAITPIVSAAIAQAQQ